ncbi:MAG: hypothetical protein HKM04_06090 [Legionellales bacterium]|nr:hypothetical protein [Legionellales bacterium]
MIKQFFSAIWSIILLRGGPQSFPYSPITLILLVGVGLVIVPLASGGHLLLLLSSLSFMLMMVWILLHFTKKTERYVQTMTALLVCEWLMVIVLLIVWYSTLFLAALMGNVKGVSPGHLSDIFSIKFEKDTLPPAVIGFLGILMCLIAIWKLLININIIKQATEWRFFRSMVFIFLLNVVPNLIEQGMVSTGVTKAPAPKTINASAPVSTPASPTKVIPLK